MPLYAIKWEIDLNADSPLLAAKEAMDCIVNGTALYFEVRQEYDNNDQLLDTQVVYSVDLLEEDEDAFLQVK